MKPRPSLWLVLVVCSIVGCARMAAAQTGWMQTGVRVWYFGGDGDSWEGLSSNATEAYLFQSVVGNNAILVCHRATNNWTSPQPVQTLNVVLNDQGPFWIPPAMLQGIKPGDRWYDPAQEITVVERQAHTYKTFQAVLPPSPPSTTGPHLLPVKALFDLQAQRQVVKLTYFIPGTLSSGNAWFDAQTGLLLYRLDVRGRTKTFFMLAEINYDFARQTAFAEDNGPHAGYRSWTFEFSKYGGGGADIQSLVETRHGGIVEMRVKGTFAPPFGMMTIGEDNYCFFDSVWPSLALVRKMDTTNAPKYLPEEWTPVGQYLWWWLPQGATGAQAFTAGGQPQAATHTAAATAIGAAAAQSINVLDVPMAKTSDSPLTYTATQTPQRLHFSKLLFDSSGYMTSFEMKDPTTGLDVKPPFMDGGGAYTVVEGLSYFNTTMRRHSRRGTDFDGDSKSDATVFRASSGRWYELRSTTGSGHGVLWGQIGDVPVAGDYDGDGKTDEAVFRKSSGTWFVLRSTTGTGMGLTWGVSTDIPVPADYDGDGKTDVAVWRPSNGVWYIIRSSTNSAIGVSWGQNGDTPVPGDFDGDGKADPTVFRNASGTWYQLRSTTGIGFGVRWGQNGDTPLAGDFDGDGKADPTLFRESNGTWYELRSTTGIGFGVSWGTVNDVPVVGDYDGDGKMDPTLFRPSSGMWYQLRSSTGAGWGIVWGLAGDVPQ